jgi:hypothetical protein
MSIEPWMRGPIEGVHTLVQPLLFSFQHAREDLSKWTDGLTTGQVWATPFGLAPVGFHVRHAGGSVERLMVYLQGGQLSAAQMTDLKSELMPGDSLDELLAQLDARFRAAGQIARGIEPGSWTEPRYVGRKKLPSTVGGLMTHIAEHTQRHVGEAIVTAKVVRATS